jgi:hypothetical protein
MDLAVDIISRNLAAYDTPVDRARLQKHPSFPSNCMPNQPHPFREARWGIFRTPSKRFKHRTPTEQGYHPRIWWQYLFSFITHLWLPTRGTSESVRFPSSASSFNAPMAFANSFQLDDWSLSPAPQTPTRNVSADPHVKVASSPVPEASPKPYTIVTMVRDLSATTG